MTDHEDDIRFVPNDDDIAGVAKARDIATDITDTLLLNQATVSSRTRRWLRSTS